eukprot:3776036-Amphidinium_carterae.1
MVHQSCTLTTNRLLIALIIQVTDLTNASRLATCSSMMLRCRRNLPKAKRYSRLVPEGPIESTCQSGIP